MDVTPLVRKGQQIIQSYAGGSFKVSGVSHDGAIIVMPDGCLTWDVDHVVSLNDLSVDDFKPLIDISDEIDVLLLGCGSTMAFIPPTLRSGLKEAGLSVDVMDTGAACRTYNVLMAEGRRVVCALLPTHSP